MRYRNYIYALIMLILIFVGCNYDPHKVDKILCPQGDFTNATDKAIVQVKNLEFMHDEVEVSFLDNFRLIVVASNGIAPGENGACAAIMVEPYDENLDVNATVRKGEKVQGMLRRMMVLDRSLVGSYVYLYFVGIQTKMTPEEIEETAMPAVDAVLTSIADVASTTSITSSTFSQEITNQFFRELPPELGSGYVVGHGGVMIPTRTWDDFGPSYNWIKSTNLALRLEYQSGMYYGLEPISDPIDWDNKEEVTYGDLIRNGDFEEIEFAYGWGYYADNPGWSEDGSNVHFQPEWWEEAVYSGIQSQLININSPGASGAIYQSFDVRPHSEYDLTFYALMRSKNPMKYRNSGRYDLYWGIDFNGRENYENVRNWVPVRLAEQEILGSTHKYLDQPLFFERIFAKVQSGNSNRITLFLRGSRHDTLKDPYLTPDKEAEELVFNIDKVSFVGPLAKEPVPTPTLTPMPTVIFPRELEESQDDCTCRRDTKDCADFATVQEAEACFMYCLVQTGRDIYNLDPDNDGLVCE